MKKIKEKKLDEIFSKYIRTIRGWKCERCGRKVLPPTNEIQCSHFHSRNARSVRYDEVNADCLCNSCHRFLEERKTAEYRDWKLEKLGKRKFNLLLKRYYTLKRGGFTEEEKAKMIKKWITFLAINK